MRQTTESIIAGVVLKYLGTLETLGSKEKSEQATISIKQAFGEEEFNRCAVDMRYRQLARHRREVELMYEYVSAVYRGNDECKDMSDAALNVKYIQQHFETRLQECQVALKDLEPKLPSDVVEVVNSYEASAQHEVSDKLLWIVEDVVIELGRSSVWKSNVLERA